MSSTTPRVSTTYRPTLRGQDRTRTARRLRAKYDAGASIRALVEDEGLSYGTTRKLLMEAGTTMRGRGGAREAGQQEPVVGR
ncbi:helix-turn-helix domain-containing protein [Streptomyces sp. NPDC002409]|uniref:helix-turn-helix domain-containing protein n=1 Tax=Streptomyces misionensis TaxID=67331 RepID=UPI00368CC5C0